MKDVAKIIKHKLNESSSKPILKKQSGTSNYGYILSTTKRNLIQLFGPPTYTSKDIFDDSSQYVWVIEMDYLDSTYVFTIYDEEYDKIKNNDMIE